MAKKIDDYKFMVGQHYGNLQVLEVKIEPSGLRNLKKAIVICTCGAVTQVECWRLLKGTVTSCCKCRTKGCNVNTNTMKKRRQEWIWECPHTTRACAYSCNSRACCRECDKQNGCEDACLNAPEKCGAIKRKWAYGK